MPKFNLADADPLGDRLLVLRHEKEKTIGNIELPSTSQETRPTGTVIRVGPKVESPKLVPGAIVVMSSYAGLELRDPNAVENEDYMILREEDLLAVIPIKVN